MQKIRERTDTVDSLDVAVLTALNLARELIQLREFVAAGSEAGGRSDAEVSGGMGQTIEFEKLQGLIEAIERELDADAAGRES